MEEESRRLHGPMEPRRLHRIMEGNHGGVTALWRGTEETTWA